MNSNIHNLTPGKALRRIICAALAFSITALITQVIVHSAGQHEYGMAAVQPAQPARSSPRDSDPDVRDSIVIARSR